MKTFYSYIFCISLILIGFLSGNFFWSWSSQDLDKKMYIEGCSDVMRTLLVSLGSPVSETGLHSFCEDKFNKR
jgi:hypothetical protein